MKKIKAVLHAFLYFIFYFAVQIAVELITTAVYLIRNGDSFVVAGKGFDTKAATAAVSDFLNANIYVLSLVSEVIFLLAIFLIFKARHKSFSFEIGLQKTNPLNILPVAALGFSMNILTSLLFLIVPEKLIESYNQSAETVSNATGVVAMLAITIVGPVAEEVLFRGLIFTRLSRGFGVTASVIVSTLIFAAAHGNILWSIYAGVLGLMFVLIYIYTRSIICPIIMHVAYNVANYVVGDIDLFVLISAFAVCAVSAAALIVIGKNDRRNVGSDV